MEHLITALNGDRPPGLYRLTSDMDGNRLTDLAQKQGWQLFYIDGRTIQTKADFFRVCAIELRFPDYFGQNWDAFEDCLRDLEETSASIYVLLFDQPDQFAHSHPQEWSIALNIFAEAVEFWQTTDTPLYVLFRTNSPVIDELETL